MHRSFRDIEADFRKAAPTVAFCSFRIEREFHEWVSVVRGTPQPVSTQTTLGGMITLYTKTGYGYAATSDLSTEGISAVIEEALLWAQLSEGKLVTELGPLPVPSASEQNTELDFQTKVSAPWSTLSVTQKLDELKNANERLKCDDLISDWGAELWYSEKEVVHSFAGGANHHQHFVSVTPSLWATAHKPGLSQSRSFGRDGVQQGGLEILDRTGWREAPDRIASQALQLLAAPPCPTGDMDAVIAGDQMVLQIHESIGHPLELDRILGDERNYAGTSFVSLDMVGTYQYGSPYLNITFDPEAEGAAASFKYDEEGTESAREFLIKDGRLIRLLGGTSSQQRAGVPGVANARASAWNRPPIDRMANINMEPGSSSLDELISDVDEGVYLETNRSWSIDDSRNKFQFGCEWAEQIKNGKRVGPVRNANYKGISADFWRSLSGVGNISTMNLGGSPYCGKGEPNQAIRVGHRTPACQFRNISVFGGAG